MLTRQKGVGKSSGHPEGHLISCIVFSVQLIVLRAARIGYPIACTRIKVYTRACPVRDKYHLRGEKIAKRITVHGGGWGWWCIRDRFGLGFTVFFSVSRRFDRVVGHDTLGRSAAIRYTYINSQLTECAVSTAGHVPW